MRPPGEYAGLAVEVAGWLLIVSFAVALAMAPASRRFRRLLGAADDLPHDSGERVAESHEAPPRMRRDARESPTAGVPRHSSAPPYPPHVVVAADGEELAVETSLEMLERALADVRAVGDVAGAANVLNLLGFIHEREARLRDAIAAHEQALYHFESLGDDLGVGDTLNNLGVVHARMGDVSEAMKHHERALRRRRGRDHGREGNTLNNMAIVHAHSGDWTAAERCLRQARDLAVRADDKRGCGKVVNNSAVAALSRERPEHALEEFRRAHRLRVETGDWRGAAKTDNDLGVAFFLTGHWREAARQFEAATGPAGELDDRLGLAYMLHNLDAAQARYLDDAQRQATRKRVRESESGLREIEPSAPDDAERVTVGAGGTELIALLSSGSTTPENSLASILERAARLQDD